MAVMAVTVVVAVFGEISGELPATLDGRVGRLWGLALALRVDGTVKALLCGDKADSARSLHVLLHAASEGDELGRAEEEHERHHDFLVKAFQVETNSKI